MAANKRVLTFQTPRKKTTTPMRNAIKSVYQDDSTETKRTQRKQKRGNPKETAEIEPEDSSIENRLIEAYRHENQMLRSLKTDALLYANLLGIKISQENGHLCFSIERESSTGPKKLKFSLEEQGEFYVFSLEDILNCTVPEYFNDVIEFEKKAFPLVFYKAMQAVYEVRTND